MDPRKLVEYFQKLHNDREINLVSLVDTPPDYPDPDYKWVTRDHLRKVLDDEPKPVIVHFLGHGRVCHGHGELLFATESGTQDWVDDQTFTDILGKSKVLKLVFLQACESASAPTADRMRVSRFTSIWRRQVCPRLSACSTESKPRPRPSSPALSPRL